MEKELSGRFARVACPGVASWFIRKTGRSQRSRATRITLKTEAGCAFKGLTYDELLYHPDRIKHP